MCESGRSRFTKSAYDLNFCKQRLHWLFADYLLPGPRLWLLLSPPEDERVSISARLGSSYVPPSLFGAKASLARQDPWASSRASLALRFQPDPANPLSFVDVRTSVHGSGSSAARFRACVFDPRHNVGVFAAASNMTQGPGGMTPVLGARYRCDDHAVHQRQGHPSCPQLATAQRGRHIAAIQGVHRRPVAGARAVFLLKSS